MKVYVDANPRKLCAIGDGQKYFAQATRPHTNNEAEYIAILHALSKFPTAIEIISDAQLIVRQLNGEYAIKKPELGGLAMKVWDKIGAKYEVLDGLPKLVAPGRVKFTWVRREDNPAGREL